MPWSTDGQWWTDPGTLERHSRTELQALNNADPNNAPSWVRLAVRELPSTGASGNPFAVEGGDEQLLQYFGNLGNAFGMVPSQADSETPGASLDTSQADEERKNTERLIAQLQQQAATGGGAWEGSLKDATDRAQSSVQALGQSQGKGYASALRNIGAAQGNVAQKSVGQGNILRAQSKQAATDQLSGLLGQQGEQDINQASGQAQVNQGVDQLNTSLAQQADQNTQKTIGAVGQGVASLFGASDGGEVPGKAPVFGDDSRNDIVPAKLSPGEIVIPRSHAGSPEDAAAFVAALHKQKGYAEGGEVSPIRKAHPNEFRNDAGLTTGSVFQNFGKTGDAPSIENGGLLNVAPYQQTRAANLQNEGLIEQQAMGAGPSVVGQQMTNATDAALMAGMRAPGALNQVAAAQSAGAGDAAVQSANEQRQGQMSLARSRARQRGQDLAMSQAQQQAAWRNTQMAAGLGLQQQALLRGITSGAGQAAMAYSSGAKSDPAGSFSGGDAPDFSYGFGSGGSEGGSLESEWNAYPGSTSIVETDDKWRGGVVGDFASAVKRRKR